MTSYDDTGPTPDDHPHPASKQADSPPATNKPRLLSVNEADLSNGRCGYDWISLSFRVQEPDPSSWHETRRRHSWSTKFQSMLHKPVPVREGVVHLTSGRVPDSDEYWGALEVVPSKLVDKTGGRLCSFAEWPEVLAEVLAVTSEHLHVLTTVDAFKFRRVDVSRDIDAVLDFGPYAHAALVRPMRYANRKNIWTNGAPSAQSVYAGAKHAGHVILYDRHQRHPDVVPHGRVRFEVRGNEGWLASVAEIRTLGDLTTEAALRFLVDRWDWFGGGVAVVGQDRLLDAADALTHDDGTPWSDAKKERYVGHMWKASRGVAPQLPSGRKAEYREAMARTGIYLTGDLTGTELDPVWDRRLDLATGYEICDIVGDPKDSFRGARP